MPWTRASELDRTINCVGSKLVPATRLVSDGVKKAAAWGTFVHHWKETGELLDTSEFYESFKKTFDKKWDIIGSPELRQELWPDSGVHEVSYAFNCLDLSVGSTTEAASKDEWKASHGDEWVTGTNDYEGEIDGVLWVDDLKTGAMYTTPPEHSYQLYFYAMCNSIFKAGGIEDVIVSITRWPKYPLSVLPERKYAFLPKRRIKKFQRIVVQRYEEWLEGYSIDAFNSGDHCVFCPAGIRCPIT